MTEDRGQSSRHLHLNQDTRTIDLMAETWDPKTYAPS